MQVLLIEDSPDDYLLISRYAAKDGDIVLTHRDTLQDGLAHIAAQPVDVLLLDMALPDGFGFAIYDEIVKQFPALPVVILSGSTDDTVALDAVRNGAQDYLVKGQVDEQTLRRSLHYAVERKRIENELAAERNLLRAVLDSSPDYILTKDLQGRYLTANAEALTFRRLQSLDQILGKTIFDFAPPERAQAIHEFDLHLMETGQADYNRESVRIDPETGAVSHFLTTKVPLRDADGRITGLVVLIRDVTLRKRTEEQLTHERNLLRTILDSSPDYIFTKDLQSRYITVNKAVLDMRGLDSVDELVGKTSFDLDPTMATQAVYEDEQRVMTTGEPTLNSEERYIHPQTGEPLWVLSTRVPLRDEDGQVTGLVTISRDITRRKQAEEAFTQERNLLRSLIDSTPDYIFIKDAEGRFIVSNIAHARAANSTPDELVGKTAFDVFPAEFAAQYHADDERVMRSGEPLVNLERSTSGPNGTIKTVLTTKIPLRDDSGRITGLVGISRDITSRKLVEAKERELAAERERIHILQRFISDLSHDLRTPLSVIGSSLYLMQRNPDPQKRQQHADNIQQQLMRLDKLLSNVLQMAHLDQQAVEMQLTRVDLNAYLTPIIDDYAEVAAVKGIALSFTPESETCYARIDEVEFASALISLLENAVAYTPDGGNVTVRTNCSPDETRIAITDNGIGIAKADLPHIFGRFYRADKARASDTGGHGLGLPIAQRIIEAHGGRISVESSLGAGSTFTIHLPTAAAE